MEKVAMPVYQDLLATSVLQVSEIEGLKAGARTAHAEIERLRAERITFRIDNVDVTAEQYVAHRVARAFDYAADIAWRHSTGEEAADAIRAAKNGGVG